MNRRLFLQAAAALGVQLSVAQSLTGEVKATGERKPLSESARRIAKAKSVPHRLRRPAGHETGIPRFSLFC